MCKPTFFLLTKSFFLEEKKIHGEIAFFLGGHHSTIESYWNVVLRLYQVSNNSNRMTFSSGEEREKCASRSANPTGSNKDFSCNKISFNCLGWMHDGRKFRACFCSWFITLSNQWPISYCSDTRGEHLNPFRSQQCPTNHLERQIAHWSFWIQNFIK